MSRPESSFRQDSPENIRPEAVSYTHLLGEDVPIQLLPLEGSNGLSLQYDGEISITKMLWTTVNYSFFVRPGMKRVSVKPTYKVSDLEAATSLMISSYTDGKEVVTVAINYLEEKMCIRDRFPIYLRACKV